MPTPTTEPTLKKVLCPQKPKGLAPGTPDLPWSQRTSTEVRAKKDRKEAEKQASVMKTKAAKSQVNELRKAIHQEQIDSDPHGLKTGSKKVGAGSA